MDFENQNKMKTHANNISDTNNPVTSKAEKPEEVPVPGHDPDTVPAKEPSPDVWPRKEPEIQPRPEPVYPPYTSPAEVPAPPQGFSTRR